MKDLLIAIASGLVEDKSAVSVVVDEPNAEGIVVYHLHVAPDDLSLIHIYVPLWFSFEFIDMPYNKLCGTFSQKNSGRDRHKVNHFVVLWC